MEDTVWRTIQMNIQLTKPDLEKFVEEQVRTGRFASAEDVIEAGLTHLMIDHVVGSLDEEVIDAIDESERQIEKGQVRDWKEVSAELRRKYLGK